MMERNRDRNEIVKDIILINAGAFLIASAVFFFMLPSHLAIASSTGLAVVLSEMIPLSVSTLTLILNISFLLLGFIFAGREFSGKTVYISCIVPMIMKLYEVLFPDFRSITGDAFLDMISLLFIVSLGQAILFSRNASSGGLDVIAKILNKYFHVDLGRAVSVVGVIVACSSILVYDKKTVVLSLMGTYLNGIVLDHFIYGMNVRKKVYINSDYIDEIREYIMDELGNLASVVNYQDVYSGKKCNEIITLVDRNNYSRLLRKVFSIDESAFVTVYTVSEVYHIPHNSREKK